MINQITRLFVSECLNVVKMCDENVFDTFPVAEPNPVYLFVSHGVGQRVGGREGVG